MAKKKKVPQIVKDIRNFKPQEINWATQKIISYSQLSMFTECPKKWSLQYREGHKQFTSTIHTVFGSALHEVLQHYLDVMYEKSGAEADRINTYDMFEEKLREEYTTQYKKNKNQHFSNPQELRQFFDEGIEIIRDFSKNKSKYFSKRGWWLVGCEVPIQVIPNPLKPNVVYNGFLDVVMYHEPTDTFKIIDIKTSRQGWNNKVKKDELKQFQLILYKKFFSELFGVDPKKIEIEYFIVKRQLYEHEDFVIKRIQTFSPPSGKIKQKRAGDVLQTFIIEAFTKEGYKEVEHQPKENNNCKWCPFYKTHLCSATFQK
jgi:RecB family exonuclease